MHFYSSIVRHRVRYRVRTRCIKEPNVGSRRGRSGSPRNEGKKVGSVRGGSQGLGSELKESTGPADPRVGPEGQRDPEGGRSQSRERAGGQRVGGTRRKAFPHPEVRPVLLAEATALRTLRPPRPLAFICVSFLRLSAVSCTASQGIVSAERAPVKTSRPVEAENRRFREHLPPRSQSLDFGNTRLITTSRSHTGPIGSELPWEPKCSVLRGSGRSSHARRRRGRGH